MANGIKGRSEVYRLSPLRPSPPHCSFDGFRDAMSRRDHFLTLRHDQPHVLPSLLSADFGNLEREVRKLEQVGVRGPALGRDGRLLRAQPDVRIAVLEALRRLTELPLDVHLMIREPAAIHRDDFTRPVRTA